MPGINGESSTSRGYAPHMWILRPNGNPDTDIDWAFVSGNCIDYITDDERVYHIGATVMGELLCESNTLKYPTEYLGPIPIDDLPEKILRKALRESLDLRIAASLHGPRLIRALIECFPEYADTELEYPEAPNWEELFNGDSSDFDKWRAEQEVKVKDLRVRLGLDTN